MQGKGEWRRPGGKGESFPAAFRAPVVSSSPQVASCGVEEGDEMCAEGIPPSYQCFQPLLTLGSFLGARDAQGCLGLTGSRVICELLFLWSPEGAAQH